MKGADMATRLEKIFKSETIQVMNSILNEINDVIGKQQGKKTSVKEWSIVSKNIANSICGFYVKHNITDEQVRRACEGK